MTEEITKEKLEELENQTNDNFTKKLIWDLKKEINSSISEVFKQLNFQRIIELIEHENKNKRLGEFSKNKYKDIAYNLKISLRGKKRNLLLNGEFSLSELSEMIQKEFDLEPFHLYEFEIGKFKFGPKCDEWQEIFDSLDNFKLGAAINATNLSKGDKFRFLYDFGDKILFSVELIDIKRLNLNIEDGK